jgi:hypothetical protein
MRDTHDCLRMNDISGRTTPIPLAVATPGLGIGKFGQDLDKLDGTIGSGRKELLVERKETEEQRKMALVRLLACVSSDLAAG